MIMDAEWNWVKAKIKHLLRELIIPGHFGHLRPGDQWAVKQPVRQKKGGAYAGPSL